MTDEQHRRWTKATATVRAALDVPEVVDARAFAAFAVEYARIAVETGRAADAPISIRHLRRLAE